MLIISNSKKNNQDCCACFVCPKKVVCLFVFATHVALSVCSLDCWFECNYTLSAQMKKKYFIVYNTCLNDNQHIDESPMSLGCLEVPFQAKKQPLIFMFWHLKFHQETLQGWQYFTAVAFCTETNLLVFLPFSQMNSCTSISRQRSRHVGCGTLTAHANSRKGCIDILMIGNDRFYIVVIKSLAAVV